MEKRGHRQLRKRDRSGAWSRISWTGVGQHLKSQLPRLREEVGKELEKLHTGWDAVYSSTDSELTLELTFVSSNGKPMTSGQVNARVQAKKREMDALVRRCLARLDNLAIRWSEHPSTDTLCYHIGTERMEPFKR